MAAVFFHTSIRPMKIDQIQMLASKIDQVKAFIWKKKTVNCYFYTLQLIVFSNLLFHLIDFWNMPFHLIGFSFEGLNFSSAIIFLLLFIVKLSYGNYQFSLQPLHVPLDIIIARLWIKKKNVKILRSFSGVKALKAPCSSWNINTRFRA